MYEYDSTLAYMSIPAVQQFLELGDVVHGIEVSVEKSELNRADQIATEPLANSSAPESSSRTGWP